MWKNLNVNKNLIECESSCYTLINCPHNSNFDDYSFWISNKLIRNGRNKGAISIGYTDAFRFRLIKYRKGKYNKFKTTDEIEIGVDEFEEMFGITDENIMQYEDVFETHKPVDIKPIENNLLEDLKDD